MIKNIKIYTDGSCSGNPGPGGWAAVIILNKVEYIIAGFEPNTTNNRMEIIAAIKALKELNGNYEINLFTDSNYLKNGITMWIKNWEKNDWKTSDKKIVKNIDLWKNLRKLTESKKIGWYWIKGHSNHPMNDLVDKLAKQATPF